MGQVIFSSDTLCRHIGHVLQSSTSDQHNIVLLKKVVIRYFRYSFHIKNLKVVANARHIGSELLPVGESDNNTFPVGAVGLLGLLHDWAEHDCLGKRNIWTEGIRSRNSLSYMFA